MEDFEYTQLITNQIDKTSKNQRAGLCLRRGKIVEYLLRHNKTCLSELSRKLGISRRTLYNWFENDNLNCAYIWEIGNKTNYDFSKLFPIETGLHTALEEASQEIIRTRDEAVYFWMKKYIFLLEEYNQLLRTKNTRKQQQQQQNN